MEQKRFVRFLMFSMAIVFGWQMFIVPMFLPPAPALAKKQGDGKQPVAANGAQGKADKKDDNKKPGTAPAVAEKPVAEKSAETKPAEKNDVADARPLKPGQDKPVPAKLKKFPPTTVKLGSIEEESGYRLYVTLTSRGAAVSQIELNDHRYRDLSKGHPPLKLVSPGADGKLTLQTTVPKFAADHNQWDQLDWEVVSQSPSEATFRIPSPDGNVEVIKRYSLKKIDPAIGRDTASAYELNFDLTFKNKGNSPQVLNYDLLGPVEVPLENIDNTTKFRDIVVGFVDDTKAHWIYGKAISNEETEEWKRPLRYIGVDVQYFAALLIPDGDQATTPSVKSSTQVLVGPKQEEKSDVSVMLTSVDLELAGVGNKAGAQQVTHSYKLFAGPKRDDLLAEIGALKVIDYGMFGWICNLMMAIFAGAYKIFHSYGIAIICLTILVRSCMFPLSMKQARSAAKMQELGPEIAAIKEKYGKDKEKFAKAQMELFSKHNYNPLGGCLPLFVQMPVFLALYSTLNHAVDLRMAKFLWVDNLAAPDALFDLPFRVPFVGWTQFNLLPIITTALFLVQQKLLMPPPTNDEEAMRNKMMNFMTIFMGFMFYKVPAGLCVYFIASSLWGLAERKLLPKAKKTVLIEAPPAPAGVRAGDRISPTDEPETEGFLARLLKAADKELSAKNAPLGKGGPAPGKRK